MQLVKSIIDWLHDRPTPRNLLFSEKDENTYYLTRLIDNVTFFAA